jgi:hypothetical protein
MNDNRKSSNWICFSTFKLIMLHLQQTKYQTLQFKRDRFQNLHMQR